MPYTFNTILLSAQKTGSPNLIGTSLSGTAISFLSGNNVKFAERLISIVSLSTNDAGVAFNPKTVTVENTNLSTFSLTTYPVSAVTIQGSVVNVPLYFHTDTLALVKVPVNNVRTYTIWTNNSSLMTVPTSAITAGETDVSDPEVRRKWLLGYM